MTAIPFDTHAYARKLIKASVPEKQADAHVEVTAEIMKKSVATKQDFVLLKQDLKLLKAELTLRTGSLAAAGAIAVLTLMPIILKLVNLI